jgi:Outer membrane lipoprotein carrier protein LolA-like
MTSSNVCARAKKAGMRALQQLRRPVCLGACVGALTVATLPALPALATPPHDAGALHHDAGAAPGRPAASAPAKPVDLDGLLAALQHMPGLEADFVEDKHIAMLARPLTSRGKLYFTHPGLLLRRVEAPQRSEVLITPDSLRTKDAAGEQTLDLRARPDVRPFVESLTWILGGNRTALASVYTLTFTPEAAGRSWVLSLAPKQKPLNQLIAEIRIAGQGLRVATVEVRETSGDRAVTRIVAANPERHFDAAERARLFGEGPTSGRPGSP